MSQDPYRLNLAVTAADGRVTRWGGDELNSKDIPAGLTFSTSIPGGFKDMSCSLMRRLDIDYPDEALFDDVRVYGPGNETAWEGRMVQFPRQHADQFTVNPGAVGWSTHLKDDPSFREIYVDIDFNNWGEPSVAWMLARNVANQTGAGPKVTPDATNGSPSLQLQILGPWTATSKPFVAGWYDAHSIPIGSLYYAWKINSTLLGNVADTNFAWGTALSSDDTGTSVDASANQRGAGPNGGTITATTTSRLFAQTYISYAAGPAGVDNGDNSVYWTCLAVYGGHGLAKQGTASATAAQGFFASDVIADVVGRSAPLLTFTTGLDGSIAQTGFIIPHLVFLDPVTAEDVISLVNGYHLYEWGVYDNKQFFWRPPNPDRLTWEARLADGAQVSLEGDDANNIFNGVIVNYTDPSGRKSTVGPANSSAVGWADVLQDTSPDNPVNAHGIPRKWGVLDVSNTTTTAGAIQLGAVWLAEHNLPTRRGQLTLTGTVQHPTQGQRPVWAVRAGDYVRIADRPNDPVRRIIETSYDHDTRRLTASLDQTVFKLEAIMERMGVSLVGVI